MALPVIGSTVMDAAYAAALPITEIYLGQLPRQVDDFGMLDRAILFAQETYGYFFSLFEFCVLLIYHG